MEPTGPEPPHPAVQRDPLAMIMERLDRIEGRLSRWESAAGPVPGVVAAATDVVDELARSADAAGHPVDGRLRAAAELAEHATRRDTLEALTRLLDRLDDAERSLELLASAPSVAATVVDIFDKTVRDWQAMGTSVDARLTALRDLATTATRPEVVEAARQLAEHLPMLARVVPDAQQLPGMFAIGVDVFDRWARTLADSGNSIEQVLRNTVLALARLGSLLESREFTSLMNSGVLEPRAVAVVGRAGGALTRANTDGAERIGLFSLMKELRDPGVRAGLAFGLNVLRAFGTEMTRNETDKTTHAGA
ncbi:MAG: DUF1641 domain-containing protein [Myxococcales bacterium]|nr:DUF1641 domain-containing protein [Myxococcales bacterium]MCB9520408.1 DUF1641 domain-containing protein [Myxococcales bacterium]MCB9530327.1 DUF1641 domain-containing protein [Myxococcales bacterium]MCB9534143.1 DUF1641 domain-containing protein [Myxococcales bacterium]